jgi:hypothetical protein
MMEYSGVVSGVAEVKDKYRVVKKTRMNLWVA